MCLAIPGRVEEIFAEEGVRMGRVNFGGVIRRVCLDYVPDIEVGEYTIVHVGFALERIDEQSAAETLELFRQMGALNNELGIDVDGPQASRPVEARSGSARAATGPVTEPAA